MVPVLAISPGRYLPERSYGFAKSKQYRCLRYHLPVATVGDKKNEAFQFTFHGGDVSVSAVRLSETDACLKQCFGSVNVFLWIRILILYRSGRNLAPCPAMENFSANLWMHN